MVPVLWWHKLPLRKLFLPSSSTKYSLGIYIMENEMWIFFVTTEPDAEQQEELKHHLAI